MSEQTVILVGVCMYVVLMLAIGNDEFHLQHFVERTLYSARHYIAFLCWPC